MSAVLLVIFGRHTQEIIDLHSIHLFDPMGALDTTHPLFFFDRIFFFFTGLFFFLLVALSSLAMARFPRIRFFFVCLFVFFFLPGCTEFFFRVSNEFLLSFLLHFLSLQPSASYYVP